MTITTFMPEACIKYVFIDSYFSAEQISMEPG